MKCSHALCLLLLLYRNIHTTRCEEQYFYRITDKVFMCSKWLSSIIDNFCNNVYKIVKRDTSLFMDKLTPKDLQNSRNMLAAKRWRRIRRQVASECCERPCTVGNIIMYCPEDAKLLKENPSIFE